MKNKRIILLITVGILLLVTLSIAGSYAYFVADVSGDSQQTVITTGNMKLLFTDGPSLSANNLIPTQKVTKTFKVKNTGDIDTVFNIYLSEIINTFEDKTDLKYKVTGQCSDEAYHQVLASSGEESKIISSCPIAPNQEFEYSLELYFEDDGSNQDDNKGKRFTAKISVNEVKEATFAALNRVRDMGASINIGDSLDTRNMTKTNPTVEDYETYWHNPVITNELFEFISAQGFKSVRIPISWSEHIDSETKIVNAEWMARVKEVVDMALNNNLYVVIDTHHEPFIIPRRNVQSEVEEKFANLWTQIATEFKDYDDRLMFEGMNEPKLSHEINPDWKDIEWHGDAEARSVVNDLNQLFVNTVRATGSNNSTRFLLITTYGNKVDDENLNPLIIPNDENIIISLHAYFPNRFVDNSRGYNEWNENSHRFVEDIDKLHKDVKERFLDNGYAVAITEFGCHKKPDEAERLKWLKYYVEPLANMGVPVFWWDNGQEEEYKIIDRTNYTASSPELVNALIGYYN